jgi:hypothetical protein
VCDEKKKKDVAVTCHSAALWTIKPKCGIANDGWRGSKADRLVEGL